MHQAIIKTPIGGIRITVTTKGVSSLEFVKDAPRKNPRLTDPLLKRAKSELDAYFEGKLKKFTFPVDIQKGSPFQRQVWKEMRKIPYGKLTSYGELAKKVGRDGAARAVGMANHVNPLPLVIPCHRVVGKSGALTGFAPGLSYKRWLLKLENATGWK